MTNTAKPVRRETLSLARARGGMRPLVIELNTTYVRVRLKGMRHFYTITYDQIYNIGARNAAEQLRQAKIEARKARRKQKGA